MFEMAYRKRLSADLPAWRERGWVTPHGSSAIIASLEARRSTFGMAAIVGVVGALLLGLGVLAFVAANWEGLPRQAHFLLLLAGMAVAYALADGLARRGLAAFADAALLVAGLIFAAAIALIGQSYHLSGDFSGALLLFEIGCLGAALVTGSVTLTALALIGAGYWTWFVTVDVGFFPHWPSLVAIVIGGAVATFRDTRFGRAVAVLTLIFWVSVTIGAFADRYDMPFAGTFALGAALALLLWSLGTALATLPGWPRLAGLGYQMIWPGLAAILVVLGILQTASIWGDHLTSRAWLVPAIVCVVAAVALAGAAFARRGLQAFDVGAVALLGAAAIAFALVPIADEIASRFAGGVIVIAAAIWVVNLGQSGSFRIGKTLGLAAFGVEILYLYVVTFGSMIDTSVAFLLGGLLFIAMAYGLYRLDRRLAAKPGAAT
jgi:uncharacterized membrane protein